jgi:hypothetical protein
MPPTSPSRRRRPSKPPGMETWLRNAVMLVSLGVWTIVVAAYLHAGQLPDAVLLGVPGGIYLALSPTLLRRRAKPEEDEETPS